MYWIQYPLVGFANDYYTRAIVYVSITFIPAYSTKINLAHMFNEQIFVDQHILCRT